MDIEDAHKLKILTFEETRNLLMGFVPEDKRADVENRIIQECIDDKNEQIVYLRSFAIGTLEHECVRVFVDNEEDILAGTFKGALIDHCRPEILAAY